MSNTETEQLSRPVVSNNNILNLPNLPPDTQLSTPQGTYDQINQLFNEQDQQEKKILEAREILGESAKDLTDSQVYDLVKDMQFLVDSWLEEFERKTFDGKTLNELLNLES